MVLVVLVLLLAEEASAESEMMVLLPEAQWYVERLVRLVTRQSIKVGDGNEASLTEIVGLVTRQSRTGSAASPSK